MGVFSVVMILFVLALAVTARADVVMPSVFGDHMVLQQEKSLPVWGKASPGERVMVRIAGREATTIANADGRWRVEFEPLAPTAEPIDIRIVGNNEIVLRDVLVGDVWLCSGQSNMEWTLAQSLEPEQAIRDASLQQCPFDDPHLRAGGVTWHRAVDGEDNEGSRHGRCLAGADRSSSGQRVVGSVLVQGQRRARARFLLVAFAAGSVAGNRTSTSRREGECRVVRGSSRCARHRLDGRRTDPASARWGT